MQIRETIRLEVPNLLYSISFTSCIFCRNSFIPSFQQTFLLRCSGQRDSWPPGSMVARPGKNIEYLFSMFKNSIQAFLSLLPMFCCDKITKKEALYGTTGFTLFSHSSSRGKHHQSSHAASCNPAHAFPAADAIGKKKTGAKTAGCSRAMWSIPAPTFRQPPM